MASGRHSVLAVGEHVVELYPEGAAGELHRPGEEAKEGHSSSPRSASPAAGAYDWLM
jgi:hypothetical protein